tara:strand:+ start:932 stop:1399 length:468 start_codon:yes stop_codon:yes gene_type:complete
MCVPQAMMLTTMVSTVASISAGNAQARATRQAGLLRNEQIERDKQLADLQAKEMEAQRWIDYNSSISRNLVMSAFAGRSATDASNMALMQSNYQTIQDDIRSLTIQKDAVNKKYRTMAEINLVDTSQRASASERMGLLSGVSTMAEGLYKIREIE